jgi:hypothetical protein
MERACAGLCLLVALSGVNYSVLAAETNPPVKIEALLSNGYEVKAADGDRAIYLQKGANVYMCRLEFEQGRGNAVTNFFVAQCVKLVSH